jgi:hypothetical protein
MQKAVLKKTAWCCLLLATLCRVASAQSPGLIIKSATGAGRNILDPNNDGYTSATNRGFVGSDADTSKTEIKFRAIKPVCYEPINDLLRGPSGGFSDLVSASDSTNSFVYCDGTNLIFRQRLGNYIPGSKSYSILVDTDGKFGYSGANADPGYTAPGNGKIGNPGFEFEICFQSNFRVAVYNVDTAGRVVLKYANTPVTDYSQVSVALSYVSGDPDYFMDFYVPMSQLGINANTPLRFASTTVMSPLPALGGPISDIFGYGSFTDYMDAFTRVVTYETPVTPTTLNQSTYIPVCTQAPTVNTPVVGNTSVSGNWARLDVSKCSTAKIYLYRNSSLLDSVTATTDAGWTITVPSIAAGTTFYARAKASSEGNCFCSPTVTAIKCNGTLSARPSVSCATSKGVNGAFPVSNSRVRIYQNVVPGAAGLSSFTLYADSAAAPSNFASVTSPFVLHDNATKAWKCDGTDGNGNPGNISNSACTGGTTNDMPVNTALAVTVQEQGKCESMPLFICPNGSLTATPTISSTLYPGAAVTGVATANSYMRLYVDSVLRDAVYADGSGNYTFSSPGLTLGSKVDVFAQSSSSTCVSTSASGSVSAYTTPPVITTDNASYIMPSITTISGTSTEADNTTLYLYKRVGSTVTSLGSTTVTSGAWTVSSVPSTTSGDVYLATQKNPFGLLSDTSNLAYVPSATTTSCASFGSSTYPANATSVSGTVSPSLTNGKVYLYVDGSLADSATSVTSSFTINTNTTTFNKLYAGATITLTAKTSGGSEKLGCGSGSTATITCSTFSSPSFNLSPSTINVNSTTSASVSSGVSGLYYSLVGAPDNGTAYANATQAASGSFSITSYSFSNAGTYNLAVRALNLSEGGTCSSTSGSAMLTVSSIPLPIHLLYFNGAAGKDGKVTLEWNADEDNTILRYRIERSGDGISFNTIGTTPAIGRNGIQHYAFTDNEALQGNAWYRLAVEETNGTSMSNAILIKSTGITSQPSVKPVPFSSDLTISLQTTGATIVTAQLSDITGKILTSRNFSLNTGNHNLTLPNLGNLPAGIYLLELAENGSRILTRRVEKQ